MGPPRGRPPGAGDDDATRWHAFADRAAWRRWLEAHHADATEAWLVHPKRGAVLALVPLADAVEEALCFGWIDGLLRPIDADRYALRYAPRRAGSVWSARNVARAERLMRDGRMTEAGLRVVAAARASGAWAEALARERVDDLPPDLEAALRERPGALAAYRALRASVKKAYLHQLADAKRPETRRRRLDRIVRALGEPAEPPEEAVA